MAETSNKEYFDLQIQRIEEIMAERDKRYEERHIADVQAVQAALVSADKQVTTAFSASEKAVNKSEEAQKDYNARSNEFRGQLDDQAKTLMPRTEAVTRFDAQDKRLEETKLRYDAEIAGLREFRSGLGGRKEEFLADRQQGNTDTSRTLLIVFSSAALLVSIGTLISKIVMP